MTYLHKRGYNRHFLRQEITRAKIITRKEALLPKSATTITTDKSECVPFILTCNPALRSISSIIRKHISILTSSHRCHNIFKSTPLLLSDAPATSPTFLYELNYAILYKTAHPQRFFSMRQSLFYVHLHIQRLTSYTFHSTDEAKPITHHITSNSKKLIHMIQCNAVTNNI